MIHESRPALFPGMSPLLSQFPNQYHSLLAWWGRGGGLWGNWGWLGEMGDRPRGHLLGEGREERAKKPPICTPEHLAKRETEARKETSSHGATPWGNLCPTGQSAFSPTSQLLWEGYLSARHPRRTCCHWCHGDREKTRPGCGGGPRGPDPGWAAGSWGLPAALR